MIETWVFLPPEAAWTIEESLPVRRVRAGRCQVSTFAACMAELQGPWRLVLPVEAVTSCVATLPARKRWRSKALPFAVEEWLAEDVELFHLALGEPLENARHRVYAVRRDWLSAWLTRCSVPPAQILMDADLLPVDATWLCWLSDRWLLGGLPEARLALPADEGPAVARQHPAPLRVCAPADKVPAGVDQAVSGDPYLWLAAQSSGCNLAQGAFAVRETAAGRPRWRALAVVLAVGGLAHVLFYLAQGAQLRLAGQALARDNAHFYQTLFPEDRRLVNLRQQFDQHLAGSGPGRDRGLLGLLGQAGPALLREELRVHQLEFSAQRGEVVLQVRAASFEALERLRERLDEAGLQPRLGSASREADGVSARLVIGGGR